MKMSHSSLHVQDQSVVLRGEREERCEKKYPLASIQHVRCENMVGHDNRQGHCYVLCTKGPSQRCVKQRIKLQKPHVVQCCSGSCIGSETPAQELCSGLKAFHVSEHVVVLIPHQLKCACDGTATALTCHILLFRTQVLGWLADSNV
jgi:hypothetical protein